MGDKERFRSILGLIKERLYRLSVLVTYPSSDVEFIKPTTVAHEFAPYCAGRFLGCLGEYGLAIGTTDLQHGWVIISSYGVGRMGWAFITLASTFRAEASREPTDRKQTREESSSSRRHTR